VLLRTRAQTRVFEEGFLARGLPHQVVGGVRFYERREIRDVLAYARLLLNRDDDASFERVVNQPPRGAGPGTLATIRHRAAQAESSLFQALVDLLEGEGLNARARVGLGGFRELVERLRERAGDERPSAVLRAVVDDSRLLEAFAREGEAAARERRENVDQLVAAAAEYEAREPRASLAGFLDGVSLLSDVDSLSGPAPCLIMTLHAAKGLEFDVVFLAGLEEGLFPHVRATGDARGLEEERRLFYVGMTRAKERLYLSFARERKFSYQATTRSPSRFLEEIPDALLDAEVDARFAAPSVRGRATSPLRPGVLVHHAKFGEGRIVDASGSGKDRRVTVLFRSAGRKRLVAQYAKLEVLS
jgi:DNA helicase-2/ATP-dependent DNA helicase PcrA